MDRIVERVKQLFGRVSQTEVVEKSVATARDTATNLGESAQKAATEAAGKAQLTATELGEKVRESATDLSARAVHVADSARETATELSSRAAQTVRDVTGQEAAPAGIQHLEVAEAGAGLSAGAQATIEESKARADAFIQDAAVELESVPGTSPESAEAIIDEVAAEGLSPASDPDDVVPAAPGDPYRE